MQIYVQVFYTRSWNPHQGKNSNKDYREIQSYKQVNCVQKHLPQLHQMYLSGDTASTP